MLVIGQVSQQEFRIDDSFQVMTKFVRIPSSSCIEDLRDLLDHKLLEKRCVVTIRNRDDLCVMRALVVGKSLADDKQRLDASLERTDSRE